MTTTFAGCPIVVSDNLRPDIAFALATAGKAAVMVTHGGEVELIDYADMFLATPEELLAQAASASLPTRRR